MLHPKIERVHKDAKIPTKNNKKDLGWDIYCVDDPEKFFIFQDYVEGVAVERKIPECKIPPGQRVLINTGIKTNIPEGYGVIFKDRSGNAFKKGLHVLAGVIDEPYIGEWKVLLLNTSNYTIGIKPGDRVCQAIFVENYEVEWEEGKVEDTDRGDKGFGSSGD